MPAENRAMALVGSEGDGMPRTPRTHFVSRIDDATVARLLVDAVRLDEGDELIGVEVDRDGDPVEVTIRYVTTLDCGDGPERIELADDYDVDDYDVEPYDWAGDTRPMTLRWRRAMLAMFGADYAHRLVVGLLEEQLAEDGEEVPAGPQEEIDIDAPAPAVASVGARAEWLAGLRRPDPESIEEALRYLAWWCIAHGGEMGPNGVVAMGIDEGLARTESFFEEQARVIRRLSLRERFDCLMAHTPSGRAREDIPMVRGGN